MKTTVIEVTGLFSVLSAAGVEKQLRRLPGVEQVQVNYIGAARRSRLMNHVRISR